MLLLLFFSSSTLLRFLFSVLLALLFPFFRSYSFLLVRFFYGSFLAHFSQSRATAPFFLPFLLSSLSSSSFALFSFGSSDIFHDLFSFFHALSVTLTPPAPTSPHKVVSLTTSHPHPSLISFFFCYTRLGMSLIHYTLTTVHRRPHHTPHHLLIHLPPLSLLSSR